MGSDAENDTALANKAGFPASLLSRLATPRSISAVFEERPDFKSDLKRFQPFKSAELVAGLLTQPSLQANTLRIELLIHLLLAFAVGNQKPSRREVANWLNTELESTVFALMEDPPEDVFVSNVTTAEGNFRIFEGLWESSDFYLQRVLNVVERFPEDETSGQLRREILGILKLSEEMAARRRLARFSRGGGNDKQDNHLPSWQCMKTLRSAITFSPADLERLGIIPADLEPFIFPLYLRPQLGDQALGESELERRPIIHDSAKWLVLLPTAISIAVRQRVLSWMCDQGYQDSFDKFYIAEYQDFLAATPILGSRIPRKLALPSKQVVNSTLVEVSTEMDAGRYLQVIAIVDGLAAFLKHGISLPDLDVSQLSKEIQLRVSNARAYLRSQEGFKQALTLLVWCGYGRPGTCGVPTETPDWKIESVSAPDLEILGSIPGESPLFLWKLVDHERFLRQHGVSIANANGLLNLYGWWSQTNYMMLDQRIEFGTGRPLNVRIPTNCLAEIRRKVRQGWDLHSLPLPNGKMVRVIRKNFDSYFPEDADKPSYGCIDAAASGKLLGAWVGRQIVWWVAADPDKTSISRDLVFRMWDAVSHWLGKAVAILDRALPGLREGAVLIVLDFSETREMEAEPVSEEVLRSSLSVSASSETNTIRIVFRDPFLGGFRHPKNIAERAIVRALVEGALRLGGRKIDENTLDMLVREIVPNEDARHLHFFEAAHFREYIRDHDQPKALFIDGADEARSKLGLGWLIRNRNEGHHLTTPEESVAFLNNVVDAIWQRMRAQLHKLDRVSLIEQSLRHIEGVEADRFQWERTIRAVLALGDNKPSVKTVAIQQITRFNAANLALRLVVEMALSECSLEGGQVVGTLDLSPLMSDALSMFHLGGWSDAIKKGVMDPEIRIAANGEILSHAGFRDEIVEPFGLQFVSSQLDQEASKYEKHFEPVKAVSSVKGVFPDQFLTAVQAEFGISFDALRGFRDALEKLALEKQKSVFIAQKSEILSYCAKSELTNSEVAKVVSDRFALGPREAWDQTPKGFKRKDWYPWRFGRRLSLISRPLVRLESGENPRYVISPGLIGISVIHALRLYYEGVVPQDQCASTAMKRWVSEEVNRRGHAFAHKVFGTMRSQNYQAHREIKLSTVLNEKLDRDLGDIDVVAWKPGDNVVLAIECKDLKLAKTPNEIAEQLNHFSGQVMFNGERDDLLKHVDRCNLLKERSMLLARFIGMPGQSIKVKAVVCFSHPVPMQYMSKRFTDVTFLTIDELKGAKRSLFT